MANHYVILRFQKAGPHIRFPQSSRTSIAVPGFPLGPAKNSRDQATSTFLCRRTCWYKRRFTQISCVFCSVRPKLDR
jgi:hypothetical protein